MIFYIFPFRIRKKISKHLVSTMNYCDRSENIPVTFFRLNYNIVILYVTIANGIIKKVFQYNVTVAHVQSTADLLIQNVKFHI